MKTQVTSKTFNQVWLIVFNPADPVATLRNLTNMGSKEIIGAMIDKINIVVDGGQLI